jgi:hypothetical protein
MVEMKGLRTPSPGTHFAVELVELILQRGGCWAASNSGTAPFSGRKGNWLNLTTEHLGPNRRHCGN